MLEMVRRAVKSWVAKVLLAVLVASFAVWGIGDVFSASLGSSVAHVGDQKISGERFLAAFNRETRAASQRFGQPVDAELARQLGIDQQVLSSLATEATLDQAMEELSLSAPDQAVADSIVNDPSFQGASGFDDAAYKYEIARAGYSVESYEDQVRRALARNQLSAALLAGATAPPGAAETLYAYQAETRRFAYLALAPIPHGAAPGAPDEAALAAFHEANADRFTAPESRDVVYLHVSVDELAKEQTPDEDAIRALYQNRAAFYDLPERRALYQTVFGDRAAAEAAHARLVAGEIDFDELLAERGETRADVSLGEVTRDEVQEAVAEAAFALEAEGVTGPIDTGFGHALVDVAAIIPAVLTPYEDARAELALDLGREAALDVAPGVAAEIEDMRAGGARLEEIAQRMGLPLGRVEALRRADRGAGLTGDGQFIAEAFAAAPGEERDIVEMADGSYFVLRVDSVAEAQLRPLEEVREEVEALWRAEEVLKSLDALAGTLKQRLEQGETIARLAEELGVTVESEGPKTRAEGWRALPADAAATLFSAPQGGVVTARAPGGAGVVIAQVAEIIPPDPDGDAVTALQAQLNQMAGADAIQLFLQAKQRELEVTVNRPLIDSILTQSTGY